MSQHDVVLVVLAARAQFKRRKTDRFQNANSPGITWMAAKDEKSSFCGLGTLRDGRFESNGRPQAARDDSRQHARKQDQKKW